MKHVLAFIIVASAACHEKVAKDGDVCGGQDEGTFVCEDAHDALLCKAEKRHAIPCRGPKGCASGFCDDTVARAGDACREADTTYAPRVSCSEDHQTQLECKKGHFELAIHCRGPGACSGTMCDRSLLAEGDECNALDGWERCSVDRKATVACDKDGSGKLALVRVCSGPKACVATGSEASCDVSTAAVGSPCGSRQAGTRTCDPTKASLLECSARTHVWERSRTCDKGCAPGVTTFGADCAL